MKTFFWAVAQLQTLTGRGERPLTNMFPVLQNTHLSKSGILITMLLVQDKHCISCPPKSLPIPIFFHSQWLSWEIGKALMVLPNFHLLQVDQRVNKTFLMKHAPTESTLPSASTSRPLQPSTPTVCWNTQFLFQLQSRQHICPHPASSALCLHPFLPTRAHVCAASCWEKRRYSSEVPCGKH